VTSPPHEGSWVDRRYAALAVLLAIPSTVLAILARTYETFPLDREVSAAARDFGSTYAPVAYLFNEGDAIIVLGALAVGCGSLVLRRHVHVALLFVIAAGIRPLLNLLKTTIDRPRPSGEFQILDVVYDSSFPSGHVMSATTAFGLWFVFAPYLLPRRLVMPARVLSVLAIGVSATSRMWAGVHWFSDTYAAVLWVATLLAVVMTIRPVLARACRRLGALGS
jgi:undecaprenyl-diphosphatase